MLVNLCAPIAIAEIQTIKNADALAGFVKNPFRRCGHLLRWCVEDSVSIVHGKVAVAAFQNLTGALVAVDASKFEK